MTVADRIDQIASLFHEVGELHRQVFRIVDGVDDDWASWYADWLTQHSEPPELLGRAPVRSELVYLLVKLDKDYTTATPPEAWSASFAARIIEHLA